jgi:hypothetical protein
MKLAFLAIATLVAASSASAQVAGAWRVTGKVASFAFTLNCDFKPAGDQLGGVCVDASTSDVRVKAGKSHVLTAGSVHGDHVTWTYRSSFLFSKFDVTYRGAISGARMTGAIDASGHAGVFTAVRN